MTRFSARLAIPLAVLLTITLAGILYGRSVPRRDECPSHELLLDARAFEPPVKLRTEGPRSSDIAKGRLTGTWRPDPKQELAVGAARTFGLPNLLLQPAMVLPGRNEPDDVQPGVLETAEGPVPIHYAYERRGRQLRITAYWIAYRENAIRNPVWTRIREGPSAFVTGTWPITLFAAAAHGHLSEVDQRQAQLDAWLRRAWEHYRSVCSGA